MSMYGTIERDGKTIVIDHFTGQPVSDEEQFWIVIALYPEKPSATPAEETESSEKQDQKA